MNLDPWIIDSDIKVSTERVNSNFYIIYYFSIEQTINTFFKQIVHLIRDPRAMINSMLKQKRTWGDPIQQANQMCFRMMSDAKYEDLLSSERYYKSLYI